MPCTKCEEGYKWGKTGECKYDSLESCESANSKYNKTQPTPLGKKTYEEYAKELKEFNLSSQKVELGLVDDILSDVNANGKSRSNYRKFIGEARASLGKANEQLENLKKRNERIIKDSKKFKKQVDELGVAKDLKKQTEYIYKGLYEDKNIDKDIAAGKQAYKELIKSSEL